MAKAKIYKVTKVSYRSGKRLETIGTIKELVDHYSNVLECGKSCQNGKDRENINCNPKNITSLVTNLYNAENNSAPSGYSGYGYYWRRVHTNN